jgi:deoxyuridine 5'-triphosphate nucleotidohydrolase
MVPIASRLPIRVSYLSYINHNPPALKNVHNHQPNLPPSGLASKHFIDTGAGVIDADYRGQVKILLFNHSEKEFEVKEGDRVAQLVLERIYTPDVVEVEELEESVRGAGGFGSTG